MNNEEELCHAEKVIIYVFGLLDELADAGCVLPGSVGIGSKGRELFAKLKNDEGFDPSDDELADALMGIQDLCLDPPDDIDALGGHNVH